MVRRRRRAALIVLLVLALLAAACSSSGSSSNAKGSSDTTASDTGASDSNAVQVGKTKFGPDDDDKIIKSAIDDVQSFYEAQMPGLYNIQFSPISGGEFPYGPSDPPPNCGKPGVANYQDVAQNAFYCPEGDFVAWDTDNLTNQLLDQFGPYTLAIVVAHELGHAIQARHGILDGRFPTFVTEQQADCFAGAYTQHVQQGGSKQFKVQESDLDNAIGGFLQIRDPVGTDQVNDESAHGSAFQRINAFEDGLKGGMEKCKTYEDESFNFVPEVFVPGSLDQARQGNLPFQDVEPLVIANLEGFWTAVFRALGKQWQTPKVNAFDPAQGVTCGNKTLKGDAAVGQQFYCEANDTLNWDEKELMPAVHDQIGDMAEAVIIGYQYAAHAQKLLGIPRTDLAGHLQQDCLTGVWTATTKTGEVNSTLPQDAQLTLSPGDLDEAVASFIQFSAKADPSVDGSAFQKVDAFRTGFFDAFKNGLQSGVKTCLSGKVSSSSSSGSSS